MDEAGIEAVTVDLREVGGGTVAVALTGELDPSTADATRDEIRALTGPHDPTDLVIDLAGVSFMDSAGVRVIVELHHEQLARGGRLSLVNIGGVPRRVLEISGLTAALERT